MATESKPGYSDELRFIDEGEDAMLDKVIAMLEELDPPEPPPPDLRHLIRVSFSSHFKENESEWRRISINGKKA
jgi:hypothetical protein